MPKQVFINLPVKDLAKSTQFYSDLGFTKNEMFSNEDASAMVWSDSIYVMLLKHDFYRKFTNKMIADTTATSAVLISLSLDSKEEVEKFVEVAKSHGSTCYIAEPNKDLDFMVCYEVEDPDGHILEPNYMDMSKF